MGVDVIWSGLRIVFQHKNDRVAPERSFGKGFNDSSEREIVISDIRAWRTKTGMATGCVIAGQMHYFESGHLSFVDKFMQFVDPRIRALLIGDAQIEGRIRRAHVR